MLNRKFNVELERSHIKTLSDKCIPQELYWYIYLKDNKLKLGQIQITFQKENNITKDYSKQKIEYLKSLKLHLVENVKIYQHFFATLYAKFYWLNNKFGAKN